MQPSNSIQFTEIADFVLEMFLVDGTAFHGRAIVVDGVWRIREQSGYLGTLGDAQADEGKDAELCGQRAILVQRDLVFRL